jgi:hypothetical protein
MIPLEELGPQGTHRGPRSGGLGGRRGLRPCGGFDLRGPSISSAASGSGLPPPGSSGDAPASTPPSPPGPCPFHPAEHAVFSSSRCRRTRSRVAAIPSGEFQ